LYISEARADMFVQLGQYASAQSFWYIAMFWNVNSNVGVAERVRGQTLNPLGIAPREFDSHPGPNIFGSKITKIEYSFSSFVNGSRVIYAYNLGHT
jgi:hypothetical protein